MKVLYLVVASCWWKICTAYYTPEALADQIKTIPGSDSALLSNQFSGYLDISWIYGPCIKFCRLLLLVLALYLVTLVFMGAATGFMVDGDDGTPVPQYSSGARAGKKRQTKKNYKTCFGILYNFIAFV